MNPVCTEQFLRIIYLPEKDPYTGYIIYLM